MTTVTRASALVCAWLAVCNLVVAASARAQDLSFEAARNFGAGFSPVSVALGDFNGDGWQDLVVVNSRAGGYVTVLLGNGDGSFQATGIFPAGSWPRTVAVGDFNGDSVPDLAVAYGDSEGYVAVLLGNGDGTFQEAAQSLAVGSTPFSIAVGDFNGDGWKDLAVANANSDNVSVLLGNGDGSFQVAQNFGVGLPRFVAVDDFNRDGVQDLAVANGYNSISVLLGNGDGSFQDAQNFAAGSTPSSVAVGDFNGDGVSDLAVANFDSNNVSVLLGNGDGSFQAPVNFGAGFSPISVAVGDFNGDGLQDLAVAYFGRVPFPPIPGGVTVLLGNGDGSFQAAQNFRAGDRPHSIAVDDFNGDGWKDLAVANVNSNNASVLINNTAQ